MVESIPRFSNHTLRLKSTVVGVPEIEVDLKGARQRTGHAQPSCLSVGTSKETRPGGCEFLVSGCHRRSRKPVVHRDFAVRRPAGHAAQYWILNDNVLRADACHQAHPSADRVTPANIENLAVNLAAGVLGKAESLEPIHHSHLIPAAQHVTESGLRHDLVAVDQLVRIIEEMGIAKAGSEGNREAWCQALHDICKSTVRESRSKSDGAEFP